MIPAIPDNINPRYYAYMLLNGVQDRKEMVAKDSAKYPGGCMAGFTLWISANWAAFIPTIMNDPELYRNGGATDKGHAAFDEKLFNSPEQLSV